jgi:hypothetical protein
MRPCRLTVVGLCVTFCCMYCQAKELWKNPQAWQQLNKKMTVLQVTELLGEPLDKEKVDPSEVWYYHQAPLRTDGRITWRPKNGFVRFKKVPIDGQEAFLLLDWKLPLWRDVPMPPPEVNELAISVVPIAPVESEKEPVKTEVNLPPPPQQLAPAPAPQPKPQTSWQDMPTAALNWLKSIPRIWLLIGGGVIAFIIYVIFFKPDPAYRSPTKKKEDNRR